MLEVDDDVHACLIGRFLDPLNQFQSIQSIEGTLKIHEQSSKLVVPLGLDVEHQLLCRERVRIEVLFQCMQRARNQLLLVQHRELRLEILQYPRERRQGRFGAGSLDQLPKLPIHLPSWNKPLARARQSFPDRRERIKLVVSPVEAVL